MVRRIRRKRGRQRGWQRGRGPARTDPTAEPLHTLTIRLRNVERVELDRLVRLAKSRNAKPARERGRSAIIASLIKQADAEQQEQSFASGSVRAVSIRLPESVHSALTRLKAREGRSASEVIELLLVRSASEKRQLSTDEDLYENEDGR
jgi:hypothetical protein